MVREKSADEVRRDALVVAARKAAAGCEPCAEAYVRLAIENGAAAEDVLAIGRRDLLRLAGGMVALTGAAAVGLLPAEAAAATVYWGTDTNTAAAGNGLPQQYYLGRLGYQTTTDCGAFNVAAARAAGNDRTYMYWDLGGAAGRAPAAAYTWGRAQAQAAIAAWHHGCNSQYVSGLSVFADIEGGEGWRSNEQAANRQVVDGWLDYFHTYRPGPRAIRLRPGIYVGPGFWDQQFGSAFRASRPFVLWLWGCQVCTKTRAEVAAAMRQMERNVLGGSHAVIWQWEIGTCGRGDFDATAQDPLNFHPVPSVGAYACSGCGSGSPCP